MQPRSEPLLWIQCLALGVIPLELLLIRLVLAGADPGPVPGVERFLIWGVGVLAPAVALWRRPADWGSLLLVRQPLASRNSDQLRISASHSALSSRIAVLITAVILLPVLWWLDDSAVLASEFSPISGQSRLVTLLLVSPLLALMVWQVQQLVQAAAQLLTSGATAAAADSAFRADAVARQRTSLGLQLLNLPALEWREPAVKPSKQGADEAMNVEVESETDDSSDQASTENVSDHNISGNEEPEEEGSAISLAAAEGSADAEPKWLGPTDPGEQAEEESSADAEGIDPTSDQEPDEAMNVEVESETDDSTEETRNENVSDDDISKNEDPDEERSTINPVPADVYDEAAAKAPDTVDAETQNDESEDIGADDADGDEEQNAKPPAPSESTVAAAASVPVEPEQPGEEQESTALDPEIRQVDSSAGGSTESHREQAEPSGGKESEPDQPSEPTPGGL
ncbi:low-complexity tail membrane protein [Synechococcus sp. MU1642]|nr:low-complexity tail membrane protein [Synechococcus sp. MU1642]